MRKSSMEEAPKSNAELQQAYRDRHGEDLRKARRVATALMSLRRHTGWRSSEDKLKRVLGAIGEFLTADEMKLFRKIGGKNDRRKREGRR